ncbi:unnamed protein product [Thlaspi arvense]|uniref:GCK domain-containing protein n=1 Tax=Thlaspi arvense TaxID=13288 RepID=A0AAU9SP95_THLAR|nr:unnamed protein product [Thlaspi arvense]
MSANSLNIAKSKEEDPSTNQGEPSAISRDVDESKTLVEDSASGEDPSTNKAESSSASSRDGDESKTLVEDSNETEEKEEQETEECGLCKYIKGGECKESFVALEKCVDEGKEESNPAKCKEVRKIFKTCMFDNPVYYEPIIAAEAHVVAKMLRELQAEKEAMLAGEAAAIAKALSKLQTEEQPVLPAEVAAIAKAFQELEEAKKKKKEEENEAKGSRENE